MMKTFIQRINPSSLRREFEKIGVDEVGAGIMEKKSHDYLFHLYDLPLSALHILKQEAISVGADLATPKEAILCQSKSYEAILLGNHSQMLRLAQKCLSQPFGLKAVAQTLKEHIQAKSEGKPQIMAILNITPDSFYEGSRFGVEEALKEIERYIELGVEIVDIGGASSKPGSELISSEEEIGRLKGLFDEVAERGLGEKIKLSIDTYNYKTAEYALKSGFKILNDILGFSDERMFEVCAKYQAEAVLMHSRGTPKDMQTLTHYPSLFAELDEFFGSKIHKAREFGISSLILDIGFGFAKELEHNLSLIRDLRHFRHFNLPLLVGASRKNTIGLLTQKPINERLSGTLAMHQVALENGADILRVHDVIEHLDMIAITQSLKEL